MSVYIGDWILEWCSQNYNCCWCKRQSKALDNSLLREPLVKCRPEKQNQTFNFLLKEVGIFSNCVNILCVCPSPKQRQRSLYFIIWNSQIYGIWDLIEPNHMGFSCRSSTCGPLWEISLRTNNFFILKWR